MTLLVFIYGLIEIAFKSIDINDSEHTLKKVCVQNVKNLLISIWAYDI